MVKFNVDFANLAIKYLETGEENLIEAISVLPASDHLYFPVGINGNFNIDLSFNFKNCREIFYQSIHELHHVGYAKYVNIPFSLEALKLKSDLADLISCHFKFEALATYAPYNIRVKENSLNYFDYEEIDNVYLMKESKELLLASYDSFIRDSDKELEDKDFQIFNDFWSGKRIAYRFGLYCCIKIAEKYGEDYLIGTIKDKSEEFIELVRTI